MNILLIAVIIVFVIFGIIGYRRGLLGVLFNLFSWIFIALFVVVVNPFIYSFIMDNTSWKNTISSSAQTYVDSTIERAVGSAPSSISPGNGTPQASDVENAISQYGITLPKAMASEVVSDITNSIKNATGSVTEEVSNQTNQIKNNIVASVGNTLATYIIRGISCLIAFVIAKVICWIVYAIIKRIQSLPVIRGVTSWIGFLLGLVKGLLITWLFMFIVSITTGTSFGQYFLPMIEGNSFLLYLYQNNMLVTLFHYFFG